MSLPADPNSSAQQQQAPISTAWLKAYFVDLLPLLTIVALILVSIFNIGYFAKVGLHFLGLIELTNIVYSVGFVFGGLLVFIAVVGSIIDTIFHYARDAGALRRAKRCLHIVIVVSLLAITLLPVFLPRNYQPDFLTSSVYFTIFFSILFTLLLLAILIRYRSEGRFRFPELMMGILALVGADFSLGSTIAEGQIMRQNQLYTIYTKSGVVYGVNLVRSSSSGFIVARERSISFLSKDEVKVISAERPVRPAAEGIRK